MKKHIMTLLIILIFLAGVGVFLYPTVSNWLYERNSTKAVQTYTQTLEELEESQREAEWEKAKQYNDTLTGTDLYDPFIPGSGYALPEDYLGTLNIGGVMASIEIPKISVELPVYHGTSEAVLQKGAGHMDKTAFPIGGAGTHAVITAHRGLTNAKLFTDLDQLAEGDVFYIHVLDEVLAYEVDQIVVVLPDETNALRPEEEKDYVTLLTCTPYAVNSHRLFVRGVRIPYDPQTHAEAAASNLPLYLGVACGAVVLIGGGTGFIVWKKKRNR